MKVTEVQSQRDKLSEDIKELITKFESDTGCKITFIGMERAIILVPNPVSRIVKINLEVMV